MQIEVIVDNTAIPKSALACTFDLIDTLENIGNGSTCHKRIEDIGLSEIDILGVKTIE